MLSRLAAEVYGNRGASAKHGAARLLERPDTFEEGALALDALWAEARLPIVEAAHREGIIAQELRKLVPWDHHDWVNPLSSSLARALEGRHRKRVLHALAKDSVLGRTSSGPVDFTLSAATLAKGYAERGALVELAEKLAEAAAPAKQASGSWERDRLSYPEDPAAVARAFLRWHACSVQLAAASTPT
jgi:hypothetical protein